MAEKEIILQGEDGQVDELVLTTQDQTSCNSLEDCVRMLFPQDGETAPRLRFKGFDGKWEKRLLSDCLEISEEKNTDNVFGVEDVLSVSDDYGVVNQIEHLGRSYAGKSVSGYKILRPGQIVYTKSPLRAKPYGIVKVNRGKAGIVSVLYAVYNTKEGVAPEYIHYYFDPAWRLNAYMRPLVNKGAKNTMNISDETALTGYIMIPKDIDEQRKIASFLQRIDEQMTVYQKQFEELKQLKSACLETMFPQEEENVPAIRFEGFDKNWYKAKASELYETYNERNHPELPVLSACQDIRGMAVRSESGYDISHDRANEVTYKVVKPGQFVIHLRSFQGGFAHSAVEGITSPAYTVFGFKEPEKHDDYFWKTIFMSKDFINRLKTITYGIRDGRSISFSEFGDMELTFPEGEEQHRIASFFHSIDTQIAVQQQNLERLKQMKQSCLGLLFPDNQSITPPLRFKGFNGEWRRKMLGTIGVTYSGLSGKGKRDFGHGEALYITFLNVLNNAQIDSSMFEKVEIRENENQNRVLKGDLLFNTSSETPEEVAMCAVMGEEFENLYLNSFCFGFRLVDTNVDPLFLAYQMRSPYGRKLMSFIAQGATRYNLPKREFVKTEICIPSDLAEQRRIATFFSSLDEQIKIQTQQVEKLKQVKKACLNQFIA